ncbi:MAG TPA: DUF4097 family beta strand repeat-containing protein [Vicinamibacterales bacterium]|nr:DUF4097 family beta strand repeat-containing protein [Vicinamibacterales bacterium]
MSAHPLMLAALVVACAAAPAAAQTAPPRTSAATPQPPPVLARPGGPETQTPQSDETVDVAKGTRLVLSNQAGEVTVRAWDRDAVRVQASHSPRERIDIQSTDNTLRVRARASRGPAGLVDFTLTVPRWMAVNLSGTYLAATIEGTTAEVNVETVGGDLSLKGGSGTVTLRSIEGEITVEGSSGKVQATTVNDSITITGVSGDIVAETTNGDVSVTNAKASSLEISTVNGDVRFEGPTAERGTYRVTTHNGDIRVGLGAQANATVFVRTFGGDFSSDFPVTLPDGMGRRDSNKRFNFTLGAGSARVELQSFQGDIHVAKGALRSREQERARRRGAARLDLGLTHRDAIGQEIRRALGRELGRNGTDEAARDVARELEHEFGADWPRELERLRDWASAHAMAHVAPTAPAPAPAPRAPRPPRPPRPQD